MQIHQSRLFGETLSCGFIADHHDLTDYKRESSVQFVPTIIPVLNSLGNADIFVAMNSACCKDEQMLGVFNKVS
jgi:hypothetical protein